MCVCKYGKCFCCVQTIKNIVLDDATQIVLFRKNILRLLMVLFG